MASIPCPCPRRLTAVFVRLNMITAESRSLNGGEHLVCVYGDNWLQVTHSLTSH